MGIVGKGKPRKLVTSCIMAQETTTMVKPTRALVILFLADSSPALSPAEVIHSMPPKRKYKRVKIPATIIAIDIKLLIKVPMGKSGITGFVIMEIT